MKHNEELVEAGATEARLANCTAQELLHVDAEIEDNSVDLVLTDPPYIISRETGFQKLNKHGKISGDSRFAISMDYGSWDRDGEGFTMKDLADVVSASFRVVKPGGTCIWFFDLWKADQLAVMLRDAGFEDIRLIEWLKTNAVPINSRANYLSNAREIAVVARKPGGDAGKFSVHPAPAADAPKESVEASGLFRYPIYHAKDRFHPTQKSLPLFRRFIDIHTDEGATVLDLFSGSTTTGAAALEMGRNFIGCEPDPEYFKKSHERLLSVASAVGGEVAA